MWHFGIRRHLGMRTVVRRARRPRARPKTRRAIGLPKDCRCGTRETFVRYLEDFRAESSQYLAGQEARLKPLSTVYVVNARSAIGKYVTPWLIEQGKEKLRVSDVTAGLLESLTLCLQTADSGHRESMGSSRPSGSRWGRRSRWGGFERTRPAKWRSSQTESSVLRLVRSRRLRAISVGERKLIILREDLLKFLQGSGATA